MPNVKKYGPYALALFIVLILVLIIFRDKISKNPTQQHIAETMMNTDPSFIVSMVKLSQELDSIKGKINNMQRVADQYPKELESWSNHSLMLQSLNQLAEKMNGMIDQLNGMQSNQNLMNNANIRQHVNAMQNLAEGMTRLLNQLVDESEAIQQEMVSGK